MVQKFKPRTSHKNVRMFYGVLAVFLIIFIFLLPVDEEPLLLIVYGFLGLLFSIVFVQAAALPYGYTVSDRGLELQHYSRKLIPFDRIKMIRLLDAGTTSQLLETVRRKETTASNGLDFLGAMNGIVTFGKLVQYCSFQIVNQDSKVGRKITNVKAITAGDFVIVMTTTNDLYLISPQDPDGLIASVEKRQK